MSTEKQQVEVDRNYETFKALLPGLLKTEFGRYALMQNREVIACFDTSRDAMQAGRILLEGKHFSVQQVTDKSVDLGHYSRFGFLKTVQSCNFSV